jgi:hypothetical protein
MPRPMVPATALAAVATRPWLWPAVIRFIPPRWWRRWPPLPLPPADYVRFRMQTMYGDQGCPLGRDELIAYLQWCRRMGPRAR